MSEPTEPRRMIAPDNWTEFLEDFSRRNYNRRVRVSVFKKDGSIAEEVEESHLETIHLKDHGNLNNVEIVRLNRAANIIKKNEFVISNVRGIAAQYDTDGSEDALEITDGENSLVSLRFELKVDGAS